MVLPTKLLALFVLLVGSGSLPQESPVVVELDEKLAELGNENVAERVRLLSEKARALSRKDAAAALRAAEEARALASSAGGSLDQARAHNAVADCLVRGGQFADGSDAYRAALRSAELAKAPRQIGLARMGLARGSLNAGELDSAEAWLTKASQSFALESTDSDLANLHNLVAVLHQSRYELKEALAEYKIALDHAELANDLPAQARLHYNLGTIKSNLEDRKGARESIEFALELMQEEGDSQFMGLIHSALGVAAWEDQDLVTARDWFERGLVMAEKADNAGIAALHLRNLADMDFEARDFESAAVNYGRSLELCREGPNRESVATSAAKLAETLVALERFDEAVDLGHEALEIATRIGMPYIEKDVTRIMSVVYAGVGDFEQALELQRQHTAIAQEIESELRSSETNRLRLEIERGQQERERAEMRRSSEERLRRQRLARNGSIGGALLLLAGLLYVNYCSRQKSKLNQRLEQQNRAILSTNEEVLRLNADLKSTLEEVHRLSGLIPICSHCKSVRDDEGFWQEVESYVSEHSEAKFSHGICPVCMELHYDLEKV